MTTFYATERQSKFIYCPLDNLSRLGGRCQYYETFLPPIIKDEIRNLTVIRQVIFVMFNLKMIVWEITQPPKILFIKKYHLCKIVPDIRHYNWCKSRLYDYKPGPDSLCCSYSYNPSHKYHSHKLSKETP